MHSPHKNNKMKKYKMGYMQVWPALGGPQGNEG